MSVGSLKMIVLFVMVLLCGVSARGEHHNVNCKKGIKEYGRSQHCPKCQPDDALNSRISLEKLTIGNNNNTVSSSDFGKVCLKGSAQFPLGFIKSTDTLDIKTRIWMQLGPLKTELTCESIHMLLNEKFLKLNEEAEDDYDYDYHDDVLSLVKGVFSHFDKTCTLRDICGLLSPGTDLRKTIDYLVELSDSRSEDWWFLSKYNNASSSSSPSTSSSLDNICSTDFLLGETVSVDRCFKLDTPASADMPWLYEMTMGRSWIRLEMTFELFKRDKSKSLTTDGVNKEHSKRITCLFIPLIMKFT
ncbi:uncharacterized protein LOC142336892 [Convolutriloba macropyga]|uniref:uncharacterized protein LOC142336892 n=1 Tax=Convolutriloba macropyga TaxID=536237 RepID=UPI003F51FD65